MLDFYLIEDAIAKSDHQMSASEFLGGIEFDEFEQLQEEKIIEAHLDFYKDFRWLAEEVVAKLEALDRLKEKRLKLATILKLAKQKNCGVIAYGD